jgi:hypothetical protein
LDEFAAVATIECWKGTLDEMSQVFDLMWKVIADGSEAKSNLLITSSHGKHTRKNFSASPDFSRAFNGVEISECLSIRFYVSANEGKDNALVVVRDRIPSVHIQAISSSQGRSLGAVEVVYREAMKGYVDRLGGWRNILWVFSPVLAVMGLIPYLDIRGDSVGLRILGFVLYASLYFLTLKVAGKLLVYSKPFIFLQSGSSRRVNEFLSKAWSLRNNRVIKWLFNALVTIILGAIGSILAGFIPVPW